MSEFLSMGGYAIYVWPAYGASALGLIGLAFVIWRRGRQLRGRLEKLESKGNAAGKKMAGEP